MFNTLVRSIPVRVNRCLSFLVLFLLLPALSSGTPISPEDVLSPDEIDQIVQSGNFFFHRDVPDENPVWDSSERKYGKHFLGKRDEYYSLEEVLDHAVKDSFPLRYKLEELYRSGLDTHIAWGGVVPGINVHFGDGFAPNVGNLFSGLFGFLLPQNWLNLRAKNRAYKATRYLFVKAALDEFYNAENLYIALHKAIIDFEIINFYMVHTQLLSRYSQDSAREIATLLGKMGNIATQMAPKRGSIKLMFDELAFDMALTTGRDGSFSASRINIKNLAPFPRVVESLQDLQASIGSKEDFIKTVLARSVELRATKELLKAAKLGVGVTAFGSIFKSIDTPANNDAHFAASLGYGTLPRILKANSQRRTVSISVEEQFLKLIHLARRAHDTFTNSMGLLTEGKRSFAYNRQSLRKNLDYVVEEGHDLDGLALLSISQMLDAELKMNQGLHLSLQAEALMRRLLVTRQKAILQHLPADEQIDKAFDTLSADYGDALNKRTVVDHVARKIKNKRGLKRFLRGDIDSDIHDIHLNREEVAVAVARNIDFLLHRRGLSLKTRWYYRHLRDYTDRAQIGLTAAQQELLSENCRD